MRRLVLGLLLTMALGGCSSIIEGSSQDILVNTNPAGARCVLTRAGAIIATINATPDTVTVPRTKDDISIVCDKDGYSQTTYLNHSGIDWWAASNGLLPPVIDAAAWGTDSWVGADNKYESPVNINMQLPPAASSPGLTHAGEMTVGPPVAVGTDDMGLRDDKNIIERFQILRVLLDEGLLTRDEYIKRRGANLGALLNYTMPPGSRDLSRPPPPANQIVSRLHFLADAFAEHSVTANEQAVERAMILEMLMPDHVTDRADPAPAIGNRLQAAAAIGRLERLTSANVITEDEKTREKQKILQLADASEAASEAAARVAAGMVDMPPPAAPSHPGPWVRLGSFHSERAARNSWADLQKAYPAELAGLGEQVTPTTLHHRPYFTLSAGPLADLVAATELCRGLARHGASCQPVVAPN